MPALFVSVLMVILINDMALSMPSGKTMNTTGGEMYYLKAPYGPLIDTPLPYKQNNSSGPFY